MAVEYPFPRRGERGIQCRPTTGPGHLQPARCPGTLLAVATLAFVTAPRPLLPIPLEDIPTVTLADYIVLGGYFLMMIGIGVYSASRIKKQEDFFLGGRSFGKLLQTFAAFGAGTGSSDPINTGRTTFTGGMSGMWSVMFWLFVTPFYWITGVWYRRMRHLTLGDWYVERYESRGLGAAYSVFGVSFFMIYGSMFFSAIAKTAEPMIGDTVTLFGNQVELQYVLIPVIAVVVVLYGMAGGLAAAYFTDLIQGLCIIGLSVMLIPIGLGKLTSNADLNPDGKNGFEVMHDQLPESFFDVIGSSAAEFSLAYLVVIVLANLTGIVVQPHFIATGGGSAKTEYDARVGLVVGNFLKRFCTLGWVLTALIAATLYADVPELIANPDQAWGYASMQLLGPGFRGLMLACLLAALMSSVDAQMVVGAGLIVRNLYVPFVNPNASEHECLWLGRLTGVIVVAGSCIFSLTIYDMLDQLQLTFWFPLVFAAPFWIGMYWRRATTRAAWITVSYCLLFFFVIPFFGPRVFSSWRDDTALMARTPHTKVITQEVVSKSMLRRKLSEAQTAWDEKKTELSGADLEAHEEVKPQRLSADKIVVHGEDGPQEIQAGVSRLSKTTETKSVSIYWGKIAAVDPLAQLFEQLDKDGNKKLTNKEFTLSSRSLRSFLNHRLEKSAEEDITRKEFLGPLPTSTASRSVKPGEYSPEDRDLNAFLAFRLGRNAGEEISSEEFQAGFPAHSGPQPEIIKTEETDEFTVRQTLAYPAGTKLHGEGNLKLNLLFYKPFGLDLPGMSSSTLNALELVPKIVMPFLVLIIASLVTPRNSQEALDRYYAKMKTPVEADPEQDRQKLESAYADPSTCERVKLLPNSDFEFQVPTTTDIVGFLVSVAVCFAIVGVAIWAAGIGG